MTFFLLSLKIIFLSKSNKKLRDIIIRRTIYDNQVTIKKL